MIRVLQIISGDLWAGAEVMAANLLNGLRAYDNLELSVLLLNEGRLAREISGMGVKTAVIDENRLPLPKLFLSVRRHLRAFKPDIVHSHRYKENFLACCCVAGLQKTGLIRTQHGMPEAVGNKSFSMKHAAFQTVNLSLLSSIFDCTVAVAEEMKQRLVSEYRCNPKKLAVIHNGTGITAPKQRGGDGEFAIGTCGRLTAVKNFSLFVALAARVNQLFPNVVFKLAGEGPDLSFLREQVRQKGLENVFYFLGHLDDMQNFYSNIDIFVSTSWHEGIPMSALEAMGHEVPVVAPNVGGFREIITPGQDGYLIDHHDSVAFAERCLELYKHEKFRKNMGQFARQKVIKHYSLKSMAEKYYLLYRRITRN